MKATFPELSLRQAALMAGSAILLMTLAAVLATDVTIGPLIAAENPAATFENITSNTMRFRTGILSWMIVLICDVIAAWGLYIFFRPVNQHISLLSAWLRIVYTAILGTSILNLNYVLELTDAAYFQTIFGQEHLEAQSWLFLSSFDSSWSLGLVVFGLHIFTLGYLGLQSNYLPKLLALFLIIGAAGYMIVHLSNLLIPQYQEVIQILGWIFILPMLSEVAMGIWLLVKGKNIKLTP